MRRVISLYTGAGGLDLGFEAAGFETAVAVEIDPEAVATLRHNRVWPVLDRDIHTVSSRELLKTAGLGVGEADALIGGPPCQPFSKSGYDHEAHPGTGQGYAAARRKERDEEAKLAFG